MAASARAALPQLAVAGYAAGFSLLPNEWFHLGWLLGVGCLALAVMDGARQGLRRPLGAGPWLVAAYLLWMTLRSCASEAFLHGNAAGEVGRGLLGTALVALFCALLCSLAHEARALRLVGWATGLAAALAAGVSLGLCYLVLPGHVAGERLQNLLVHGGLNPVCTGLVFGFAALWLVVLVEDSGRAATRRVGWLLIAGLNLATFFTGSRGAMLALACGHGALLLAGGWRRGARACAVLAAAGLLYFTSAPLLGKVTAWREAAEKAAAASVDAPADTTSPPAAVPGITHHWEKAVERGDNGRLPIYRAGWNAMGGNLWTGIGQWGVRDVWQCDLQPDMCSLMTHLHSAFFATFVHGGIIGAALLLAVLACALRCAWRAARRHGEVAWITLLAFGCGGLLFDGESLTSLATAPRYEGLLFWLPVALALARGGLPQGEARGN